MESGGARLTQQALLRWMVCAAGLAACAAPGAQPKAQAPVLAHAGAAQPAPPEDPVARYDPVRPAVSYLDQRGESLPRRARVAFHGELYAVEPGEGVAPMASRAREEAPRWGWVGVAEERPKALRVLIEDDGLRVAAYAPRGDFHPVVRRRARTSLGIYHKPRPGERDGVWLRPGLIAHAGGGVLRSVTVDDRLFKGEAWVARKAIDRVFEPELEKVADNDAWVAAGSIITSTTGTRLVVVPGDTALAVAVLERAGGRARVRYASEALWVEGWVASQAVSTIDDGTLDGIGEAGGGSGWGISHVVERYLHADDELSVAAGEEVIGRVIDERVRVIERGCDDQGCRLEVFLSRWSFVPMWLSAADAAFGDAWEAVYLDRVRLEPLPSGTALPIAIAIEHDAAAKCWETAVSAGAATALDLRIEWKSARAAEVPRVPGLGDEVHACLTKAFDNLYVGASLVKLPVSFMLRLEPVPLPARPG